MTRLHIPTVGSSKELWGSIRGTAIEGSLLVVTGQFVAKAKVRNLDIRAGNQIQVLWLWMPVATALLVSTALLVAALHSRHPLEELATSLALLHGAVLQWAINHLSFTSTVVDQVECFLGPNDLK